MASPSTTPRIVELAAQISSNVAQLQEKLSSQGVPTPSFSEEYPEKLPSNVFHLQDAIIDATNELNELLMEPLLLLFKFAALENIVSIDAVVRYKIPDMIPAGGKISFDKIAEKTGLTVANVRRLVQHCITMRILTEPEPGMVAHTRMSKFLTNPIISGWVEFEAKETWPANTRIVDAIQEWPNSQEPNETGFVLANNGQTIPQVMASNPTRAAHFAAGMAAIDYVPGHAIENITSVYDWASLGDATIVNVGGSKNQAAVELAKNFPKLKFIVQDSEPTKEKVIAVIPTELQSRIKFAAHGLFDPQDVTAPVYFFRSQFRNLADKYAVGILKAHIPVMKAGVKILIQEVVMPDPGMIALWKDRQQRSVDLALECFSNGRERHLDEWKTLLAAADERFVLHHVFVPEQNLFGIIEVHWEG